MCLPCAAKFRLENKVSHHHNQKQDELFFCGSRLRCVCRTEQPSECWAKHEHMLQSWKPGFCCSNVGAAAFPRAAVFVLTFKHTKASFNNLAWKRVQIRVQGSRYDKTRVWFMNNADMDNQRGRFSGLKRPSTIENDVKGAKKNKNKNERKKSPLSGKRWQRREHRRRGRADVLLPRRSAPYACARARTVESFCFSVAGSQTIRSSVLICLNVQSTVRCISCMKSAM